MSLLRKIFSVVLLMQIAFHTFAKSDMDALRIIHAKDVDWGYLNPLRGDKSPGAANLWGNRSFNSATGMLVRFNKGFSSPPHIHNISYRGIVLEGFMHNDEPSAPEKWLPKGSFWTQPAGHVHITAANGETNLIYLEIDHGPYLVKPSSEKFNNGEKPINVHKSNLVWLNQDESELINTNQAKISHLWKNEAEQGVFIKLAKGFKGRISKFRRGFHSVVTSGQIALGDSEETLTHQLETGSYFYSTNTVDLKLSADEPAIIYIRFDSNFEINDSI